MAAKVTFRQYSELLQRYLRPQAGGVVILAILLGGSIALQLLIPQIMRSFIDGVLGGSPAKEAARLALAYLGIAVLQQTIGVMATYAGERVGWAATNAMRADLTDHCLQLDLSFHNAHTPGEMIERIDGDVTTLSNFFSRFTILILGSIVLMVGILVLLFREDWRVGLAAVLFAAGALFVLLRFRDISVPHWAKQRQASAELFGFLEERLAATEDIRANAAKPYVMRRFYEHMRTLLQRSLKAGYSVNLLLNTIFITFAIGNAIALAVGAYLYGLDEISIGTVYLVFQYINMLQRPIDELARQTQELQRASAGIVRIREILGIQSRVQEPAEPAGHLEPQAVKALEVDFQNVTFAYPDHSPTETGDGYALREVSFHLKPGTTLGLLGRTGSGKTSLTRLLFRLYDPTSGRIRLGPAGCLTDLRLLPLAEVRTSLGMVTQNIQLFNATVRDNLTFFAETQQDDLIIRTLQDLGLGDWLAKLPKGLDTELESGGAGLSAGQAQLLAFARIFLQDPGLVILDEASSRLDPATETLIEQAVDRLVQGRTAIIIAHRLHTVSRADEILILEGGQVLEAGQRQELVANPNSRFARLLQTGLEDVLV